MATQLRFPVSNGVAVWRFDWAMRRPVRGAIFTLVTVVSLSLYTLVQRLTTPVYSFETSWDQAIPFVPEVLPIYLMLFPLMLAAGFARVPEGDAYQYLFATVLAIWVSFACFLLIPATMTRPDPSLIENSYLRDLFIGLRFWDEAHNTFPSLHVIAASMISYCLWRIRGNVWAIPMGLALIASVLLVKQHVIVDVLGGIPITVGSIWVSGRVRRWLWPH